MSQAEIEAVEARLSAAISAGDAGAAAREYADDAVLLLPRRPPLVGRDAVEAHLRGMLGSWEVTLESETEAVLVEGSLAALRGTVSQRVRRRGGSRGTQVRLRHLLVLRREPSGDWRVVWDSVQEAEGGGGLAGLLRRLLGR